MRLRRGLVLSGVALLHVACATHPVQHVRVDECLRQELLARVERDQTMRAEFLRSGPAEAAVVAARVREIDRDNTARMKAIVAVHGWPGRSLVGVDGAHAAWLLVQHADGDREFQKECLELIREAVTQEEADGVDLAYLTDRVLVGEGKRQLYGTQFTTTPDGKLAPSPISDEVHVDERRAALGLPPLREYRRQIERLYSNHDCGVSSRQVGPRRAIISGTVLQRRVRHGRMN